MKFVFNWLKEFVAFEGSAERLASLLTMGGLEVESLTPLRDPEGAADWLFEVGVTPNRGDCLSVLGIAREVAALSGAEFKAPKRAAPSPVRAALAGVGLSIADPDACSRYSAKIVEGVRIGPSPQWLRYRLESCGVRAINNVVDVTNYVMLEMGQPLHAFDLDRFTSAGVVVRRAGKSFGFTTLDGVERALVAEDLLICDGERPIALAGVMGGADTEVTDRTTRLFIESASFDPVVIRRTSKRLGLRSEASHRFERGVDPQQTLGAAERAVELITRLAGGSGLPEALDQYPSPPALRFVELRARKMERLLGTPVETGTVTRILESLGLQVALDGAAQTFKVTVPSARPDLTREADLIEEVARIHGYDKIPVSLPPLRPSGAAREEFRKHGVRLRNFLTGQGLTEVINLPFLSARTNRLFPGIWGAESSPVVVLNPLVKDQSEMRLSLLPGLLENLKLNLAHHVTGFHAFHLGKAFRQGAGGEPEERQWIAGLLYGPRGRSGLRADVPEPGFLDCKGLVEGILELLRLDERASWTPARRPFLHPGRSAEVELDGSPVGCLGQSHPDLEEELGIPSVLMFELDFERLVQYAPRQIKARSLPRFPTVERDFALLLDRGFPSERIIRWIKDLRQPLIERVEVFDEYVGPTIPEGKKSLAYRISYRAQDRTLTDGEVNDLHQGLINRIGKVFNAQTR